ncbi:MAG: transposase [Candidatus Competibacter sp.]|nr:transposase [Candidatus Competibacter sp.]MDG4583123.1 transposase [Candidatus Competibacter sp.]
MSEPFGTADSTPHPELERLAGERDIAALSRRLLKLTMDSASKAGLDEYLGHERHAPTGRGSGNGRNGYSGKTLKGDLGEARFKRPGVATARSNRG